jgi:hypothetical protein
MKKTILFLAVLLAVGCSKKENGDDYVEDIIFSSPIKEKLKEFNLLGRFDETKHIGGGILSDTLMYFTGTLKDAREMGFIILNSNTKEIIADIVSFSENKITVNRPYGEKEDVIINASYCSKFAQNGDASLACVVGYDIKNSIPATGSPRVTRYIFIKNGNKINYFDENCIGMVSWWYNFVVAVDGNDVRIYNKDGERVTPEIKLFWNSDISAIKQNEIISDYEAIHFDDKDVRRIEVRRIDLRKDREVWMTKIDLSKLGRPRIDSKTLIEKTDTHFTYEINYTEYSGNKGVIKFKVNIETGNVEYL